MFQIGDISIEKYIYQNNTEEYGIKKGDEGIAVLMPLTVDRFESLLFVEFELTPAIDENWIVSQVMCFEDIEKQKETEFLADYESSIKRVSVFDLKANHQYTLKFLFHPRPNNTLSEKQLRRLLMKDGIKVKVR